MFFALADPVILKPSCAALEMIAEVLRLLVESLGLAMVEGLRLGWKAVGTPRRFDAIKLRVRLFWQPPIILDENI